MVRAQHQADPPTKGVTCQIDAIELLQLQEFQNEVAVIPQRPGAIWPFTVAEAREIRQINAEARVGDALRQGPHQLQACSPAMQQDQRSAFPLCDPGASKPGDS